VPDDIRNFCLAWLGRTEAFIQCCRSWGVFNLDVPGLCSVFSTYMHSQTAKHNESLVERQMINVMS